MMEHFRGDRKRLARKYAEELHANEVAILPYYVANLNIESTYAALTGEYEEFQNLCFVDTLDNVSPLGLRAGHQHDLFASFTEENVKRVKRQNARKISVIIGNPPYNANQQNENDNNKDREYGMLTGELRSKIDAVWNAFWAGGIANPIEVIEQITYLLFLRGLDEAHTREENKANRLGKPMARRIFPEGKDGINKKDGIAKDGGLAYEDMRWSRLKNQDAATMYEIVADHVFPFLRNMGGAETAHATHMKGARFTIPTPALLTKVVDLLADIPMEDRDTKGDLYEYMLGKIASAGQNGQFRTPRHIISLMVEMTAPTPKDVICDPACGTCGFLVAAGEYLRDTHPKLFQEKAAREHFHEEMFHGFDFDGTMLRIGSAWMRMSRKLTSVSGI